MRTSRFGSVIFAAIMFVFAATAFGQGQQAVNPDGSFTYTIPIEIPPGIGGAQPNLALVYNSNAQDSMVGLGWQLTGLPVITRMAYDHGINYDGNDTYVGPGGRLVDMDGSHTTYHTVKESWGKYVPAYNTPNCGIVGLIASIEPCQWTMTDSQGSIWHFGEINYFDGGTGDARIEA